MVQLDKFIPVAKMQQFAGALGLEMLQQSAQKGEVFLSAGQKCDYLYLVKTGFVRVYYYDLNGNEMTHWFSGENAVITSPFSFLRNEENILYFEALEDTEMVLFSKAASDMVANNELFAPIIREVYGEFIMIMSRRVMSIHTETAEQRYLKLIEQYPYLLDKAQLSHVASYLGIKPQSLSRIRKKLAK